MGVHVSPIQSSWKTVISTKFQGHYRSIIIHSFRWIILSCAPSLTWHCSMSSYDKPDSRGHSRLCGGPDTRQGNEENKESVVTWLFLLLLSLEGWGSWSAVDIRALTQMRFSSRDAKRKRAQGSGGEDLVAIIDLRLDSKATKSCEIGWKQMPAGSLLQYEDRRGKINERPLKGWRAIWRRPGQQWKQWKQKRRERSDSAKEGKGRRKRENDSVTHQMWRDPTGCLAWAN